MWGQKHGMNSRGVAHTEPRVARPIISFGTRHTARMRSFGSHFEAHVRRSSSVAPSRRISPGVAHEGRHAEPRTNDGDA